MMGVGIEVTQIASIQLIHGTVVSQESPHGWYTLHVHQTSRYMHIIEQLFMTVSVDDGRHDGIVGILCKPSMNAQTLL